MQLGQCSRISTALGFTIFMQLLGKRFRFLDASIKKIIVINKISDLLVRLSKIDEAGEKLCVAIAFLFCGSNICTRTNFIAITENVNCNMLLKKFVSAKLCVFLVSR